MKHDLLSRKILNVLPVLFFGFLLLFPAYLFSSVPQINISGSENVATTDTIPEATFKGGEIHISGDTSISKNISDASVSAQITVEKPNSSTTWKVGREETIEWTTSGVYGDVRIWLYRGDGELVRRIYRWSGSGPAPWTVPPYIEPGNDYYMVIFSADDPDVRGRTDGTFTIDEGTGPYITMLSPTGGEKWTSGEEEEIRWTSRNVQGEVEILLYREGTIFVEYISRGTSDDGTYNWTVPDDIEPRTDYYVGVRSLENESVWDTKGLFQIGYANSDLSGIVDTRGEAWDVQVSGNYAYIADEDGGLTIADITNPSNAFEVGSIETPGRALTIDVIGNLAYVADERGGLQVYNISDPANPTEVGSFDTLDDAWGIAVSGDHAYIAVESDGLQIIDISDPENLTEIGRFDTPGNAVNVQVRGDYAYVADYSSGLRILDISDPANPTEVSFLDARDDVWDVDLKGTYAYVADHGLRIIDISDPANPAEVSNFEASDSAWDVTVSGNYAYIAADNAGIRTIDVSDPANPVETGFFNTPDPAYGVSSEGEYVYVAAEESGVYIIRNQSDEDVTPPAVPDGLNASLGNGQITLTWNPNSETDLAEYRLYRFALPQEETEFVATISAGTESYTDTEIVNGRTYSYWVTAVDQNGNESGFSNEVQVEVGSISEPSKTISLSFPQNGPQLETISVPENGNGYIYYNVEGEAGPFYSEEEFTIGLLDITQSKSVEANSRFLEEDLIQIEIPYDLIQQNDPTEFQINDTFAAGESEYQLNGQEVTFTASPTEQTWTRTWSIFAGGSAGISGSVGSIGAGVSAAAAKASISGEGGIGLNLQINDNDRLSITRRFSAGIASSIEAPSVNLVYDNFDVDAGVTTELVSKKMGGQTFSFSQLNLEEDQKKMAQTGLMLETLSLGGIALSPTVGLIVSATVNTINNFGNVDQFFEPAKVSSFEGIGLEGSVSSGMSFRSGPINISAADASAGFVLNGYIKNYENIVSGELTKIKLPSQYRVDTQDLSHSIDISFMSQIDLSAYSWGVNFGSDELNGLSGTSLFSDGISSEMAFSSNFNQNNELEFLEFSIAEGGDLDLFTMNRSTFRTTTVQIPADYSGTLVEAGSNLISGMNPENSILFGNSIVDDFQSSFNIFISNIDNETPLHVLNSELRGKGLEYNYGITLDGAFGVGLGLSLGFDLSLYDEVEFTSDYSQIFTGGKNYVMMSSNYDSEMSEENLKDIFESLFSGAVPLLEEAIRNLTGRVREIFEEGVDFVVSIFGRDSEEVGRVSGSLAQHGEYFANTYSPRSNRVVQKAFDTPEVRKIYSSPNVLYSPIGKAAQTEPEKLLEVGSEVIIISQVTDMSFIPEGENEPVDELDSSITLELEIKESDLVESGFDLSDMDRVKIYRYDLESNSWIRLDGELDENTLTTDIQKMGSYALGIEINRSNDEIPPEIYDSGFLEETEDESIGEISANLRDDRYGSGIDFSQSYILLNGDTLSYTLQPTQNRIFYQINEEDNLTGNTEEVKIVATDLAGNQTEQSFTFELVTTNNENDTESPGTFELMDNYPNPFNPQTVIPFSVPEAVEVQIRIYDVLGRYVATLLDERVQAGHHEVVWNTGTSGGQELSTGVYFYQIKAGDFNQVKKMTYLK